MDNEPMPTVETQPRIIIPEGLSTLDKIPPISHEVLPTDVCVDALVSAANIGNEQIGEIIKYEAAHPNEDTTEVPATFADMLDTSVGNFAQRAAKAWIKLRNPEGTVKLMKAMQVDDFQKAAINVSSFLKRTMHIESKTRTNYTLGDTSVNSLVDFATNQTGFNEAVHLGALAFNSAVITAGVATGHMDVAVAVNMGAFALNSYCVLAQRYTRARLSMAIDRALRRNKHFDPDKYTNALGIRFPEPPKTESK